MERFDTLSDQVAVLGVEAMLQFLDLCSFVLHRNLRLLETPPKVLIPMSEVPDQLFALFCCEAVFDLAPLPLNSVWRAISPWRLRFSVSPGTPLPKSRIWYFSIYINVKILQQLRRNVLHTLHNDGKIAGDIWKLRIEALL